MNIDDLKVKYEEIKLIAIQKYKNKTITINEIHCLIDMVNANKRTDLIGYAFYNNLEIFINDAYIQIVKGKNLMVGL